MQFSIEMSSLCHYYANLQPTLTGANRVVTHDIPVSVVPDRLWADYQEPDMPEIDVSSVCALLIEKYCFTFLGKYISTTIETFKEHY